MIKTRKLFKICLACLCMSLALAALVGCSKVKVTKDGGVDYFKTDVSKFVKINPEDYANMTAILPSTYLVTDDTVQDYIDNLLFINKKELNGGQGKIDVPIKYGDTAYIFYEGFIDGVAFEGGSNMSQAPSQPYALSIGSKKFIDDFEEQLIGVIPNQTSETERIEIKVTFPENYQNDPKVAGKEATFLVYVTKLVQFEVPKLNDETIKGVLNYTSREGNTENLESEYRAYVKKNLEAANEAQLRGAAIENLLDQLLNKATFKTLPEEELEYYRKKYISDIEESMAYYTSAGHTFESIDDFACQYLGLGDGADWQAYLEEEYTEIIKKHLVCNAIAQQQKISITDDDYENEINYYIQQGLYEEKTYTRDDIIEIVGEDTIRKNAMYSKICSMLYDNATIKYE